MITVKNFKQRPFRDTEWEIVGAPVLDRGFAPLALEVLETEGLSADPMFHDFDEGRKRYQPPGKRGEAPGAAETAVPGVDPELHQRELSASYERGLNEGLEAGKNEALQQIAHERQKLKEALSSLSREIAVQSKKTFSRVEKEAVQLALAVAKKILVTTAEVKPDYIFQVIRDGLKCLGAAQPVRIRTSPQDFEFLEVIGLPPELSTQELGIEYVADESVKSGCIIETNFGMIDLELEKMWEQVKEQLYEAYR